MLFVLVFTIAPINLKKMLEGGEKKIFKNWERKIYILLDLDIYC